MKDVLKRDLSIVSHLRKDARITLTTLSKKTGIPVSSVFEKLKSFRASGLVQPTALVDFEKLGFNARVLIALKVDKDIRDQVEKHFSSHWQINTEHRVNNGYSIFADCVFRCMREAEDFLEDLETRFRIRKKMVFYALGDIKRGAFLSNPETAELVVFGGENGRDN